MELVNKEEFAGKREEIIAAIRAGKILIYPTDTIYGIGCDATNPSAVRKVREIKKRPEHNPMSVIAPSTNWILENCMVEDGRVLEQLPGPFTIIFPLKNKQAVAQEVNLRDDSLGVRIPAHWFTEVVQEVGVPFVTTSVNFAGEKYMQRLSDVPEEILNAVDYVIYEGEKKNVPSTKINLVK